MPRQVVAPGRESHGFLRDALIAGRYVWHHPSNRGHRARALVRALAFQFRGRVLRRSSRIPCGTRSVIEIAPSTGASGLAYANPLEINEIAVWRRTLQPGDLFLDIGAHVGSYSIWAIEAGARVIAVEADPTVAIAFRRNMRLNGYEAELIEAAVSDRDGEAMFTVGLGVLNHLVPANEAATAGSANRRVRTITIDALLGDRFAAGVKIDVEGAEALALRGATNALREHRIALLQLEWNPQSNENFGAARDEVATLLTEAGYELCRPASGGILEPIPHLAPGPDVFARAL